MQSCFADLLRQREAWMWFKWHHSRWLSGEMAIHKSHNNKPRLETIESQSSWFCRVIVWYFFWETDWTLQLQFLRQIAQQLWLLVEECMHIAFSEATSRAIVHALDTSVTSQRRIGYSNPNKDQSQLLARWRRCLAHCYTTNMSAQSRDNTAYHRELLLDGGELYHKWPLGW